MRPVARRASSSRDDTAGCPIAVGGSLMRYRADIDGLRALAIIPVLFYHVGVPGFAGGFVGVDVFFVISGYLICGLIDADIKSGSFSLGEFLQAPDLADFAGAVRDVPGHQRSGLRLLPARRTPGIFQEPCERGRFGFEHLLRGDGRIFRCTGCDKAFVAYLVAGCGGAVLPHRPLVDAARLSLPAEARQVAVCDPRRAFLRGGPRGELSEHRLHILSYAVSCLGADARRTAFDRILSGFRKPDSAGTYAARRGCCLCSARWFLDPRRLRFWP